ncbi:MAG: hypothetical protein ABI459_04195, partial [Deltaproteobacteria bacterium]
MLPRGTSTSIAAEIDALQAMGEVPAIHWLRAAPLGGHSAVHPLLAARIETKARLVRPEMQVHAKIAIIHHPLSFAHLPAEPLPIRAGRIIMVVNEPPFNAFGQANHALDDCVANASESLAAPVTL